MTDEELIHLRRAEPTVVEASSVPLLRHNDGYSAAIGSATAFSLAGQCFLITAKHVLEATVHLGAELCAVNRAGKSILVSDDWACSDNAQDVAVYPLSPAQAYALSDSQPATVDWCAAGAEESAGCFIVSGYPAAVSEGGHFGKSEVILTRLRLRVGRFKGDTAGMNFDPNLHFLLNADERLMKNEDNIHAGLVSQTGYAVPLVDGLGGVSGGGVWALGLLANPFEQWRPEQARLVGVETAVFKGPGAIKVTRLREVMGLLAWLSPELQLATRGFFAADTTGPAKR